MTGRHRPLAMLPRATRAGRHPVTPRVPARQTGMNVSACPGI